jgi:hypothetical protein
MLWPGHRMPFNSTREGQLLGLRVSDRTRLQETVTVNECLRVILVNGVFIAEKPEIAQNCPKLPVMAPTALVNGYFGRNIP